jgi:S-adenosylmethionine/arginine decarboxylase-like enzyme
MDNKKNFGTLLIYDCKNCEGEINDKKILSSFLDNLVEGIMNMKIINKTFEWFDDNSYNRQRKLVGYSITAIISLSSITIHICSQLKTAYIDIFTCCSINENDKNKILYLIKKVFKPDLIRGKYIDRGLNMG